MVWSSAARVLIDEIAALGAFNVGQPVVQPEQELELRNAVERLVTSISIYAPCCPLMSTCIIPIMHIASSLTTLL